jgi:hypothetical protein
MRRLARLGRRKAAGLLAMVVLCLGVAVAAIAGQSALALALLAVLLSAVLAGVLLLARRIGGLHRAHQASIQDLRVVVEQLQRRVVAAVEKERLTAGDRHLELIEALAPPSGWPAADRTCCATSTGRSRRWSRCSRCSPRGRRCRPATPTRPTCSGCCTSSAGGSRNSWSRWARGR